MAYLYMLRVEGGALYTGITTDFPRRLRAHLSGRGAKFTRAHPVREIAGLWEVATYPLAARWEKKVQSLSKAQKEALLQAPASLGTLYPLKEKKPKTEETVEAPTPLPLPPPPIADFLKTR